MINLSRTTSPRAYVYSGPENHKSIRWISAGYPPDEIRFVAIERRALLLAIDKRAFLSVVFISLALDAHWPQIGSHPVDIRRISNGGIYDFPALIKVYLVQHNRPRGLKTLAVAQLSKLQIDSY